MLGPAGPLGLNFASLISTYFKVLFAAGGKQITIIVTNYNRRYDCDHHPSRSNLFPITLFQSFVKSINGRPIAKGLESIPVACEHFEKRKAEYSDAFRSISYSLFHIFIPLSEREMPYL